MLAPKGATPPQRTVASGQPTAIPCPLSVSEHNL